MALTPFENEMTAVAIAVAAGCRPCTRYHLKAAATAGASAQDIERAVAAAVCVRNAATDGMRRLGLGLDAEADCGCQRGDRLGELMALGAAFAVHCEDNVVRHHAAARAVGVEAAEVAAVVALATTIHEHAWRHAENALGCVDGVGKSGRAPAAPAAAGCCGG